MKKPATATRRNGTVRCAIYTRKSSEEGLEQEFNSLQAQREACEAFIESQRQEGWVCLRAAYDDGGFSGATMDRPALQRLLADLSAGRVDTIVVYKIDRLTRSLADFAKIVEILDASGASFVSVTQQFNTTTSMGRLTLNVLLSLFCCPSRSSNARSSADAAALRIPAAEIEQLVSDRVHRWLLDPGSIDKSTAARLADPSIQHRRVARAAEIGNHWPELPVARKRAVLTTLIERIEVRVDRIDLRLRPPRLAALLDGPDTSPQGTNDEEIELLSIP